jgi:hypothetical protein
LLAVALISADVEIGVRKQGSHFADKGVEKGVGAVTCWIHGGIENSPLALDLVRSRTAGEIGITYKPGSGVPGYVKLRHYADTAVAGVGNDVANLFLGIKKAVRTLLLQ